MTQPVHNPYTCEITQPVHLMTQPVHNPYTWPKSAKMSKFPRKWPKIGSKWGFSPKIAQKSVQSGISAHLGDLLLGAFGPNLIFVNDNHSHLALKIEVIKPARFFG
jgi:hypothetical protein